jgi:hypothetical protein
MCSDEQWFIRVSRLAKDEVGRSSASNPHGLQIENSTLTQKDIKWKT